MVFYANRKKFTHQCVFCAHKRSSGIQFHWDEDPRKSEYIHSRHAQTNVKIAYLNGKYHSFFDDLWYSLIHICRTSLSRLSKTKNAMNSKCSWLMGDDDDATAAAAIDRFNKKSVTWSTLFTILNDAIFMHSTCVFLGRESIL